MMKHTDEYLEELNRLCEKDASNREIFFVHSLGTWLSLSYIRRNPDRQTNVSLSESREFRAGRSSL